MFQSARLKLTLWYLLILFLVSVPFSAVLYRLLSGEVTQFVQTQRMHIERRFGAQSRIATTFPYQELITESKRRLLKELVFVNAGIMVIAGGLSYILAGKTLQPIKEMVDEQHRFVSDASHELKTPLTSLKSAFEVYLRDSERTRKDADELVQDSIGEVDKLHELSESLLQLAQYQLPSKHTAERLELTALLKEAVKTVAPMARKKRVKIEKELEAVADVAVFGDHSSLSQLFTILLDNAVKYSPEQSKVTLSAEQRSRTVAVRITDQGSGIAKEDLPHIFDRFYRADKARCATTPGYGLGLSIAQKIAEESRGSISVESEQGKHTSFTVQLPRVRKSA